MDGQAVRGETTPQAFVKLVSVTWLFYDILLTFNDEVEYIWKRRWALTKILYLLTRYTTFIIILYSVIANMRLDVSEFECKFLFIFEPAGTFWILLLVQAIIQYRVYMMYGKNQRIKWVNLGLWLLEFAALAVLAVFVLPHGKHMPQNENILGSVCNRGAPGGILYIAIPAVLYESWLLALVIRRAVQEYKQNSNGRGLDRDSIIFILTRDNILYFTMMIASVLVFIIIIRVAPVSPGEAAISLAHSAMGVGVCRIVLITRRAADGSTRGSTEEPSQATMVFERRTNATAPTDYIELDNLSNPTSSSSRSPQTSRQDKTTQSNLAMV